MKENIQVLDKQFNVLIAEERILSRVQEIAKEMTAIYQQKKPIFIAILNGSFMFATDIIKQIDFDCEITFTKLSSYEGFKSGGNINTIIGLNKSLKNRHVVILEDIIDTGRTMHYFTNALKKEEAASVAICSLLVKPTALEFKIDIDFVGFEIEDKFVVGYGLDYEEYGRNYNAIYQLAEEE